MSDKISVNDLCKFDFLFCDLYFCQVKSCALTNLFFLKMFFYFIFSLTKDCNVSDADTFSKCSPSYWGGQSPPKPHWMCDNNSTRTGLCALLCVHTQDSAYLGLYRREKSTIPDLHIFKNEWIPGDQFR